MKIIVTLAFLLVTAAPAIADDMQWKPVNPAHLALKSPVVEKDADAEVVFWEVLVDFGSKRTTYSNYICIKIFTERGKESHGKIDLPYLNKTKIEEIAARTIKANGSVIELNAASIFERTIIKINNIKLRAKSFALPSVEVGDMIEYRWREVREYALFLPLPFQRDIPIQSVKYSLKTPSSLQADLRLKTFNGQDASSVWEKDGLRSITMTNLPAFHEEPDMPPENQVRTWVLAYFVPPMYGFSFNKYFYEEFKSSTKLNDEMRRTAANLIGDATTPEQKLQRLFDFCHTKIRNVNSVSSGLTDAERDRVKDDKTAADTLKHGMGTEQNINLLFAALALAAGFDARLAKVADRNNIFFEPRTADPFLRLFFMTASNIAVKVGNDWRFYDPASAYVPYGMLRWQQEAQPALLVHDLVEEFEVTPLSPPEKSLQKRMAKLKLSEDGTLEGDVTIEYSGHPAVERRLFGEDDSPTERERVLREQIKARISNAELSDIKIENITDPTKPVTYAFHVRVPDYAQRTGKRLFFQPAFFQKGLTSRFPASERRHMVYFHYPWTEDDQIGIELPAGYELDHAESIGLVPLGNVGKYKVEIGITKDHRMLVYKRNLIFGIGGNLFFPVSTYIQVKRIFDATHEMDNHTITLKQSAAAPSNQ